MSRDPLRSGAPLSSRAAVDSLGLAGLALFLSGCLELLQSAAAVGTSVGAAPLARAAGLGLLALLDLALGRTLWRSAPLEGSRRHPARGWALARLAVGAPAVLLDAALHREWLLALSCALSCGALLVLLLGTASALRARAAVLLWGGAQGLALVLLALQVEDRDLGVAARVWLDPGFARSTPRALVSEAYGYQFAVPEGWFLRTPEARARLAPDAAEALENPRSGARLELYVERVPWNSRVELHEALNFAVATARRTLGTATLAAPFPVGDPSSQLAVEHRFEPSSGNGPRSRVVHLVSHQHGVLVLLRVVRPERDAEGTRGATERLLRGLRHRPLPTLRAEPGSDALVPTPLPEGLLRDESAGYECRLPAGWYRQQTLPPDREGSPSGLRAMAVLPFVALPLEVAVGRAPQEDLPSDHALALALLESSQATSGFEDLGFVTSGERGVTVHTRRRLQSGTLFEAFQLVHREGREVFRFVVGGAAQDVAAHRRDVDAILESCHALALGPSS